MKKLSVVVLLLLLIHLIGFGTEFIPHDPIDIDGNENFAEWNGVVGGMGKADDPFVLEGWAIIGSMGHGITVKNTDAYCIIRNCQISTSKWSGLVVESSSNVTIEGCTIMESRDSGVQIHSSNHITVYGNQIREQAWGIGLHTVSDVELRENLIMGSSESGMGGQSVNKCIMVGNEVTETDLGVGLYLSCDNVLTQNEIHGNSNGGIDLWPGSSRNELSANTVVRNSSHGIWLQEGSNENVITLNTVGSHTYAGLLLTGASLNHVTKNTLSMNLECDIDLDDSSDNTFVWNSFLSSTPILVSSTSLPDGMQTNVWDNGFEGNYWNVFARWDSSGDGLSDLPLNLGEREIDRFPLMRPWYPNVAIRGVQFSLVEETATVVNWSSNPQEMDGFSLVSLHPTTEEALAFFAFPEGTLLEPGQVLTIRSVRSGASPSTAISIIDWVSETGDVWNDWGGIARLIEPDGTVLDEYVFDMATGL